MGNKRAVLVLKDGTIVYGRGFGATATRAGELVFNTSMSGYQEALTDPSYAGQILLMTYPLIGNYGIDAKDGWNASYSWFESSKVQVEGFAIRELNNMPEHRESTNNLAGFLSEHGIPGICDIDTRYLVKHVRKYGVVPAVLATYENGVDVKKLLDDLTFRYEGINFVERVTTKERLVFGKENKKTIVLIDYGVKMGIVRELVARNLKVVVLPSFAKPDVIRECEPSGVVLSNGPGDPAILTDAHETIRKIADDCPVFGICLGHQLLTHAFEGTTYKLKFGHRGSNHPVLDMITGRVSITTQNHGYATDHGRMPKDFEITHINVNDRTIEGMRHISKKIFSVQYHPEASPGPRDSKYLFDTFVRMLD